MQQLLLFFAVGTLPRAMIRIKIAQKAIWELLLLLQIKVGIDHYNCDLHSLYFLFILGDSPLFSGPVFSVDMVDHFFF